MCLNKAILCVRFDYCLVKLPPTFKLLKKVALTRDSSKPLRSNARDGKESYKSMCLAQRYRGLLMEVAMQRLAPNNFDIATISIV